MTTEAPSQCPRCGQPYGQRKRCYYCTGRQRTGQTRICGQCATEFYVQLNQLANGEGRFCSYECKHEASRGPKVIGTKYIDARGYVMVKVGLRKYRAEHRLVVEAAIGRPLATDEQVHHINGVKNDNRIENLQVLTNAEHQRLHDHLDVQHEPRSIELMCHWCGSDYQTRPSRATTSRFCSAACRLKALHEGNRKT